MAESKRMMCYDDRNYTVYLFIDCLITFFCYRFVRHCFTGGCPTMSDFKSGPIGVRHYCTFSQNAFN